jgi:microsomal dipeptidase-like Zn-dependent dipeptidase
MIRFKSMVAIGLAFPLLASGETFSIEDSLRTGRNPGGPWTAGEITGVGGTFTAYTSKTANGGMLFWTGANPASGTPAAYMNLSSQPVVLNRSTLYGPGVIGFHPGPAGRSSAFRFVAPANGAYSLSGSVFGQDFGTTTTEISVAVNGVQQGPSVDIFGFGPTSIRALNRKFNLQKDGTLDIIVGSKGNFSNDSTGLTVRMTRIDPWTPELRGYADIHNHQFANLAFGGKFVVGKPYGAADEALSPDRDRSQHGILHAGDIIGNRMDDRPVLQPLPEGGHPDYRSWPRWDETNHQKVHQDWLRRAVTGGLRLMVMLAVDSPILCKSDVGGIRMATDGRDCDDEAYSLQLQLDEAVKMQDAIDAEAGGAGQGWYRIVLTPAHAREVIAAGKLAVVLGVESLNVLTTVPTIKRIAELRRKRVRHLFPIHQANNYIGGASYFDNRIQRRSELIVDADPIDPPSWLINGITRFAPILTQSCPEFAKYGRCNTLGLTDDGKVLMEELLRAGLLVDVDHMSQAAFSDTLDLMNKFGAPAVAGHAGFNAVNRSGDKFWNLVPPSVRPSNQDHEGQLTLVDYQRVLDSGGMVGLILSQGRDIRDVQTFQREAGKATIAHRCGLSTETFAQAYLYAVDNGDQQAVAFGTDVHTPSLLMPSPRFESPGERRCAGGIDSASTGWGPMLRYPFTSRFSGAPMSPMTAGTRTFDYNFQGFSTIGQLPDLIADMETLGVEANDLEPLFHSAEAYVRMWERAEAAAARMPRRIDVSSVPGRLVTGTPQTFVITAEDIYRGDAFADAGVQVVINGAVSGRLGMPITMTFPTKTVPGRCEWVRQPRPHRECEPPEVVAAPVRVQVVGPNVIHSPQALNVVLP